MSRDELSIGNGVDASVSEDAEVARVLDEYLADLEAGRPADPGRLLAEYPAIASQLRACLEVMHLAGRVAGLPDTPPVDDDDARLGPRLADYRIVRQIGRGGMGIVYEAEQRSLRRRVALKVLPLASALDPRQLRRFHVEAQAAAQLHYTHIVPVYAVGCERGVHYYAMQYIEGKSLAELVRELRHTEGRDAAEEAPTLVLGGDLELAGLLASGQLAPSKKAAEPGPAATPTSDRPPVRAAAHAPSSSSLTSGYFRTVANLGVQAAEALEHAHQEGVIHRDIKPANLMVDVKGHLWITDFGLARLQNDSGLTMSGDLVGTIRYMSPEQAIGHRAVVDRRTDIYALGVTLYELVALEPAFGGADRREVLRRIVEEEPRPLRARSPAVPRELETIIQKAIAKEPESRYPTAQDRADDLRRFLEHRPIRARRASLLDRVAKWSRRHRTVVASAFLFLLLSVGGLSAGVVLIGRERDLSAAKEREAAASAKQARGRAVELERQLYVNRVNHAFGEWRDNNIALADRLLRDCPRGLRGWQWDYCRRLCHLDLSTLPGDGRPIHSLAFLPDGRSIVTAAASLFDEGQERTGAWTLWDVVTGRVLRRYPAAEACSIAVDPSGTILAVGAASGPIALWKIEAEEPSSGGRVPLWVVRDPVWHACGVAFHPDGRELAVIFQEGKPVLETWEVGTRRRRHRIELAGEARMRAVAYGRDGKQLAVACPDGTVRIWDAATGAGAAVLRGHTGEVCDVVYSPDGRSLASGGRDETVRVWDLASGGSRVLGRHGSFVRAVAFHPDGTRIASASQDSTVRVWDVATEREIGVLRGHTAPVSDVAFSPEGRRIASASYDGTVRIWNSTAAEPTITLSHTNWVPDAVFTPDGSAIVSACWDNVIRIWDAETGREVRTIHGEPKVPITPLGPEIVHSLAISPDGRRIASTNRSGTVLVWDLSTGRLVRTLHGHRDRTLGVAFHPGGRHLASASWDGTVRIWDGETGEPIRQFRGPGGAAITATYSPDGTRIASAFTDGTIRIWDPADGAERMQLACESRLGQSPVLVNMVAFRPDGRWLAACSNPADGRGSGEVRVFDLATGRRVLTLPGDTTEVWGVTFTPDGRRIVTSGVDRTVKFWETETGQEVLTLRDHTNGVISVAFSPDGRRMVTGSTDNTARIWDSMSLSEVSIR